MSHDLFAEVSTPSLRFKTTSRWTIILSIAAHVAIVALVLIIPLMAADVLPTPDSGALNFITAVAPPPEPPAPRLATPRAAPEKPVPAINPDAAPIVAADRIEPERPTPAVTVADRGLDLPNARADGLAGSDGLSTTVAAQPDPPPTPTAPIRTVRSGPGIREPVKVRHVAPIYPAIAQSARIAGSVVIDAIIGTDGVVRNARVLTGVALLNQAALDAVSQWRYTPTTLNGVPVQVVMTVKVTFALN